MADDVGIIGQIRCNAFSMWHSVSQRFQQRTGPGIRFHTLGCFWLLLFFWLAICLRLWVSSQPPDVSSLLTVRPHLKDNPFIPCIQSQTALCNIKIKCMLFVWDRVRSCLWFCHASILQGSHALALTVTHHLPLHQPKRFSWLPFFSISTPGSDTALRGLSQSRTSVLHNLPPPWIWASNSQNCYCAVSL